MQLARPPFSWYLIKSVPDESRPCVRTLRGIITVLSSFDYVSSMAWKARPTAACCTCPKTQKEVRPDQHPHRSAGKWSSMRCQKALLSPTGWPMSRRKPGSREGPARRAPFFRAEQVNMHNRPVLLKYFWCTLSAIYKFSTLAPRQWSRYFSLRARWREPSPRRRVAIVIPCRMLPDRSLPFRLWVNNFKEVLRRVAAEFARI